MSIDEEIIKQEEQVSKLKVRADDKRVCVRKGQ
jgi:hypothetical protein